MARICLNKRRVQSDKKMEANMNSSFLSQTSEACEAQASRLIKPKKDGNFLYHMKPILNALNSSSIKRYEYMQNWMFKFNFSVLFQHLSEDGCPYRVVYVLFLLFGICFEFRVCSLFYTLTSHITLGFDFFLPQLFLIWIFFCPSAD